MDTASSPMYNHHLYRHNNYNTNSHNNYVSQSHRNSSHYNEETKKAPCKYFQSGTCKYGDQCRFLHAKISEIDTNSEYSAEEFSESSSIASSVGSFNSHSSHSHNMFIQQKVWNLKNFKAQLDPVSLFFLNRKPLLHIIVLFAADFRVRKYAEEILNQYVEKNVNCFFQIENENQQFIRPENLPDIIHSSASDFLIVVGDKNYKNNTVQMKKFGKLVEVDANERLKCTLDEWESNVNKSSKFENLGLDIVDSLTEEEIQQILEEICGLRHIEDRYERLAKMVSDVKDWAIKNARADSYDEKKLSNLTSAQNFAIRLHRDLHSCYELIEEINIDDAHPLNGNKGVVISCKEALGVSSDMKKVLIEVCEKFLFEVEKQGDYLSEVVNNTSLWEAYRQELQEKEQKKYQDIKSKSTSKQGSHEHPAAPANSGKLWICPKCTLENKLNATKCRVCGEKKPETHGWKEQISKPKRVEKKEVVAGSTETKTKAASATQQPPTKTPTSISTAPAAAPKVEPPKVSSPVINPQVQQPAIKQTIQTVVQQQQPLPAQFQNQRYSSYPEVSSHPFPSSTAAASGFQPQSFVDVVAHRLNQPTETTAIPETYDQEYPSLSATVSKSKTKGKKTEPAVSPVSQLKETSPVSNILLEQQPQQVFNVPVMNVSHQVAPHGMPPTSNNIMYIRNVPQVAMGISSPAMQHSPILTPNALFSESNGFSMPMSYSTNSSFRNSPVMGLDLWSSNSSSGTGVSSNMLPMEQSNSFGIQDLWNSLPQSMNSFGLPPSSSPSLNSGVFKSGSFGDDAFGSTNSDNMWSSFQKTTSDTGVSNKNISNNSAFLPPFGTSSRATTTPQILQRTSNPSQGTTSFEQTQHPNSLPFSAGSNTPTTKPDRPTNQPCLVCGKESLFECTTCIKLRRKGIPLPLTFFCCAEHQRLAWAEHQKLHEEYLSSEPTNNKPFI